MELGTVVDKVNNGKQTQQPMSTAPTPIVESEYIQLNGPFITISSCTVMDWRDSNPITIENMTVKTIEEVREVVKKALYENIAGDVKIYSAGIEVNALGDFCTNVVSSKGNTLFTVIRS